MLVALTAIIGTGWIVTASPSFAPVYAVVFLTLAYLRPHLGLMVLAASALWQHDLGSGLPVRFSLAEINLLLMTPIALVRMRRLPKFGFLLPAILLYFGVCALSIVLNDISVDAIKSMIQMGIIVILASAISGSLPRTPDDCIWALRAVAIVGVIQALAAIVGGGGFVLGLHKNATGANLCCAVIVATELWLRERDPKTRKRWLLVAVFIAVGLLVTLSRGGILAAAICIYVLMAIHGKIGLAIKSTLVITPLLAMVWMLLPDTRKASALELGKDDWNVKARFMMIDYAWSHYERSPWIGVGVGLRETYDATNLVMLTLAETGIIGMGAFAIMHLALFGKMVLGARSVPYGSAARTLSVLAIALILARLLHGMVDHFWTRGSITVAWMTVGMALFALNEYRKQRMAPR